MTRILPAVIGALAAILFAQLTGFRLNEPGFYYDELHQAPAAFHYLGSKPAMFTREYRGIPVLNMSYSGAIKSTIYGLYLRYVNPHFTAYSWRMLGVLFVSVSVFVFYVTAGRFLSIRGNLLFAALVLTDGTLLLTTRHDWGPTALGFALRLIFLAVFFSIQIDGPTPFGFFCAGAVAGFAVFEKLVAVVLAGPLAVLLLTNRKPADRRYLAAAAGLLIGAFPLLVANYSSFRHHQGLVSLSEATGNSGDEWHNLAHYAHQFLALGNGEQAGVQVFGSGVFHPPLAAAEPALMVLALVLVSVCATRLRHIDPWLRVAGRLLAAYALVAVGLLLLPRDTYIHHWVQATPFQYAAIAAALGCVRVSKAKDAPVNEPPLKRALQIVLILFLAVRLANLVALESEVASNKVATAFAPAFNRLGEIAASRTGDSVFISADWGTATQIYCFANGKDNFVYEPYWNPDPAQATRAIIRETKQTTVYVVTSGLVGEFAEASKAIENALAGSDAWMEVPIEKEFENLAPIHVRKFVRSLAGITPG